jgi:hypothetical protein
MSNFKKTFSFHKQLKKGGIGEKLFIECYHDLHPVKSPMKEVDIFINNNEKVELKSDFYSQEDTPNLFIELIGNTVNNKLGGPHLSLQNDIDWFVYLYINDRTFYWFNTKELCDFIDNNGHKYETKEIKNYGWSSLGLLVPREDIQNLVKRKDIFN